MKTQIYILTISLFSIACNNYSDPETAVEDIRKKMIGKWDLIKIHTVYYNTSNGAVISDSIFTNVCKFELTSPNWYSNNPDDFYPKIIFPNKLVQKSAIINYLYITFAPIPQDFSGTSILFWDPDSYQKRLILWGSSSYGSLHLTLNREITSKNKEKWWIVKTTNNSENSDSVYFFEEWVVEKVK